jgi:hypothetical protein
MYAVVAAVLLVQGAAAFSTPQRWRPPATRVAPLEGAPIHAHEVEAAIEVAVKAALHTATSAAFWEVAGAFVAGGLFFSTVAAACGAVYTYGEENVLYGFGLVRRLITRSWELFYAGLGAAKDEFLTPGVGRKRWKKAWNAVGSGVTDARQAAKAGVEAIKAEARLQAFALGPPGLQALNHVVKQVTPFKLAAACEEAIKGACADFEHPSAKKMELKSFSMGETPPKLTAARAYDVGADAMAFDIDIKWRSELNAELEAHLKGIGGPRVPVSLRNARVEGTVRLVLTPLGSEVRFGVLLSPTPPARHRPEARRWRGGGPSPPRALTKHPRAGPGLRREPALLREEARDRAGPAGRRRRGHQGSLAQGEHGE